jgi:hypothetical protein
MVARDLDIFHLQCKQRHLCGDILNRAIVIPLASLRAQLVLVFKDFLNDLAWLRVGSVECD